MARKDKEMKHREHSQPSIMYLLNLELSKSERVISKTKRVNVLTTKVLAVLCYPLKLQNGM